MIQTSERTTINFIGTVNGKCQNTIVSNHLQRAYRIKEISAYFAPGVNRDMQLRVFVSLDESAPTTEQPQGTNILVQHSAQDYLTGDDNTVELAIDFPVLERSSWIKIHATNNDSYQHSIIATITIEFEEEGG